MITSLTQPLIIVIMETERNDQIERQGWLLAENYHHRWLQVVKHQHQQVNWLLVDQIMLTTVCHSKIFITNLMTGKCHHQPSSFLSRTFPPLPQDRHHHIFHEPEHDYQLTLFHPRRSWTMWFSILRSRLTRPLVRLTSAFPIPPTRFSRRSVWLSFRKHSFRDVSAFAKQCCGLLQSIHWESRRQTLTSTHPEEWILDQTEDEYLGVALLGSGCSCWILCGQTQRQEGVLR